VARRFHPHVEEERHLRTRGRVGRRSEHGISKKGEASLRHPEDEDVLLDVVLYGHNRSRLAVGLPRQE
jgi:hypothetical protein